MARVLFRALNAAERRIFQPHVDALNEAQVGLRLLTQAFEKRALEPGITFDPDTMAYWQDVPDAAPQTGAQP